MNTSTLSTTKDIKETALVGFLSVLVFLGAFLLFEVEPLTGKIITPLIGGTSQVWIVCLLFFQIVVLFGYLLTFILSKLPTRTQIISYIALFGLSLYWCKIPAIDGWIINYSSGNPTWALLLALTAHLSIPCIVLSSISGTMQVWQTMTGSKDPYKLYSLSNLGSFGALLAYPVLIEPKMTVSATLKLWELTYFALFALAVLASGLVWKYLTPAADTLASNKSETDSSAESAGLAEAVDKKKVLRWLYLSTLGSAALLAFSSYLTSDVSPVPLLWVLPLAIYLMTFVVAFAYPQMKTGWLVSAWIPLVIADFVFSKISPPAVLLINLILLFQLCMVTNVDLAASKPQTKHLPAFYLAIAAGGAFGGILVAIFAPLCFNFVGERILIIIAFTISQLFTDASTLSRKRLTIRIALASVMSVVIGTLLILPTPGVVDRERNFFGSVTVRKDGEMLTLQHGNVIHGRQYLDPAKQGIDVYQYGPPAALVFGYLHQVFSPSGIQVAVIGLGAGSMAIEAKKGDVVNFYEIDPKVDKIAKTWFSYISHSKANVTVEIGDGRLLLRDSNKQFDGICIDAFGGDAVPVHLLTTEAMQIYLSHLKPDGVLFFHITNSYLNLAPVLGNLADSLHMDTCQLNSADATYVVMAPKTAVMKSFIEYARANGSSFSNTRVHDVEKRPQWKIWTDNYSNLFDVLKWH